MDYGNAGPGNRIAQGFERLSEEQAFNPERLEDPNQKEQDPAMNLEGFNDSSENGAAYTNPGMLGGATVQAVQFGGQTAPLGQIVNEGVAGMKTLTEEQVIGTDISKFEKNGVSKEMEEELDKLKTERNLYQQAVKLAILSKKSLSSSFADRSYLEDRKVA